MRTTLDIDIDLMQKVQERVKAPSKTALVEMGLQALLRQTAEQNLIAAGGTMPNLKIPKRRTF